MIIWYTCFLPKATKWQAHLRNHRYHFRLLVCPASAWLLDQCVERPMDLAHDVEKGCLGWLCLGFYSFSSNLIVHKSLALPFSSSIKGTPLSPQLYKTMFKTVQIIFRWQSSPKYVGQVWPWSCLSRPGRCHCFCDERLHMLDRTLSMAVLRIWGRNPWAWEWHGIVHC